MITVVPDDDPTGTQAMSDVSGVLAQAAAAGDVIGAKLRAFDSGGNG